MLRTRLDRDGSHPPPTFRRSIHSFVGSGQAAQSATAISPSSAADASSGFFGTTRTL
jgi:hypothetical protein